MINKIKLIEKIRGSISNIYKDANYDFKREGYSNSKDMLENVHLDTDMKLTAYDKGYIEGMENVLIMLSYFRS